MKQRFKRIEAGRQPVCHRVLLALLWVAGGSGMLSRPAQAVPGCNTAEENAAWPYTCYQQDGANTLQWMPLLVTQDGVTVLKAITNTGDAANASGDYNTSGYRLPYVQELALLLGFDESNTEYNAFAAVPYMHAWFNLPTGSAPDPDPRRLLSATNNGSKQRLMMSLADGTVTPVEMLAGDVIPDDAQTTIAILVRNFPAQFRIALVDDTSQCLTAAGTAVTMAECTSKDKQLWRYHIASGCLHSAAEQEHANKCLGLTGSTVVNLTGEGGVYFDGQYIKLGLSYLRVVGSNVNWKGDPNEATSFTLLPP